MIKAVFVNGFNEVTTTESLTQWDYGRKLCIEGLDYYNLPEIIQVHFCDRSCNKTIVRVASKNDTCYEVSIPDKLLENQYSINAFIYIDEGTRGETIKTIHIPVIGRKQPEDYVDTGDERVDTKLTELQEAISELNDKFARVYGLNDEQLIIEVCQSEPEVKQDNVLYVYPDSDYAELVEIINSHYESLKAEYEDELQTIEEADAKYTQTLERFNEVIEIFEGYAWNRDLVVNPNIAIASGEKTLIHTFEESVYNRIFEVELYFVNVEGLKVYTFKLNVFDWLEENAETSCRTDFYLGVMKTSNDINIQYYIALEFEMSSSGATLYATPYQTYGQAPMDFVGTVGINAIYEIRKKVL